MRNRGGEERLKCGKKRGEQDKNEEKDGNNFPLSAQTGLAIRETPACRLQALMPLGVRCLKQGSSLCVSSH
jgi:hypothetical protein